MAQIFVAHSGRDTELVNFFLRCFYGTNVNPVFEEIERIDRGEVTTSDIEVDIDNSNALFVILTTNVESRPYTRDWVVSEAARKKDTWVFELHLQLGNVSVAIPFLRHYVLFRTDEAWMVYIRDIIKSYDDSHVIPTVAVGGGIGGALGGVRGALIGIGMGKVLSSAATPARPKGIDVICDECSAVYNVHIASDASTFRCPVCNVFLQLQGAHS